MKFLNIDHLISCVYSGGWVRTFASDDHIQMLFELGKSEVYKYLCWYAHPTHGDIFPKVKYFIRHLPIGTDLEKYKAIVMLSRYILLKGC